MLEERFTKMVRNSFMVRDVIVSKVCVEVVRGVREVYANLNMCIVGIPKWCVTEMLKLKVPKDVFAGSPIVLDYVLRNVSHLIFSI